MKHTAKTALHFSTHCLISSSLNFNRLMLTSCEIIQMKPIKIRSRSLILKTLTCRQMSLKKTKLIHIGWMKTKRNSTIQNRKTVIPINNTEKRRRYVRLEFKYDTYQPYTQTSPLAFLLYFTHKHTHTQTHTYTYIHK